MLGCFFKPVVKSRLDPRKLIKEDFTQPRSPIVAKCFRFLKLSEGLGSGFYKMINGWKSFYKVKPKIEYDFDYYKIVFPLKSDGKSDDKKYSAESRKRWILKELKLQGRIESKRVVEFFGIHKDTAIGDLNKLIESEKIVKKGSGPNTWYEMK